MTEAQMPDGSERARGTVQEENRLEFWDNREEQCVSFRPRGRKLSVEVDNMSNEDLPQAATLTRTEADALHAWLTAWLKRSG